MFPRNELRTDKEMEFLQTIREQCWLSKEPVKH